MSCFENMRGLLPSSMLDWPGKICAVLFLGGCNFRCPYCHNPELLGDTDPTEIIDWDDLAFFLRERAGWLDGVSVTGGEPTLHGDLPLLCEKLKELGMAVKIDSNGSHPRLLSGIFTEGLADFVAMDLKSSLQRYPQVVRRPVDPLRIGESIDAIIGSGIEHEFRCTVVPGLVGLEDLESLARRLEGAAVLILQQFRSDRTLEPSYAGARGYADEVLLDWADKLSRLLPTRVRGLVGAAR
jgi:pyruvate formate lyase activating enzyme